jgi:ribonucleoside-diphosphate reductase alpha chain
MAVKFGSLAESVYKHKYAHVKGDGTKETWEETSERVAFEVIDSDSSLYDECRKLITDRQLMPAGRYLYAAGRKYHQVNNCALLRAYDSRQGWADLVKRVTHCLMTGMGVGIDYSDVREKGASVGGLGGKATGPTSLMQIVNETGRHIQQGGSRRSALWAGLRWDHPDVFDFIHLKDWPSWMEKAKREDFNAPARMDGTNISVLLDDAFFFAYHSAKHAKHSLARRVYREVLEQMLRTGEPGFSIDVGEKAGETLRNACTEVTSRDDNDVCNLASLNLARFDSLEAFRSAVHCATGFLLHGTIYSHLPYAGLSKVRAKSRRLGLGLMGLHEWLLRRGKRYGPDDELSRWLAAYRDESDRAAKDFANKLSVAAPVGRRAVAPTGSIAIVAETTSGIEPIFSVAFRRRYLKGDVWHAQYVIDSAAERLIRDGIRPDDIEDAYSLAADPARRLDFQTFVQSYVDQGISSTLNLPSWGSELNNPDRVDEIGSLLFDRLPLLRGVTAYPDGSRGGQPLEPVPYAEARAKSGVEILEYGNTEACKDGVCGA